MRMPERLNRSRRASAARPRPALERRVQPLHAPVEPRPASRKPSSPLTRHQTGASNAEPSPVRAASFFCGRGFVFQVARAESAFRLGDLDQSWIELHKGCIHRSVLLVARVARCFFWNLLRGTVAVETV